MTAPGHASLGSRAPGQPAEPALQCPCPWVVGRTAQAEGIPPHAKLLHKPTVLPMAPNTNTRVLYVKRGAGEGRRRPLLLIGLAHLQNVTLGYLEEAI